MAAKKKAVAKKATAKKKVSKTTEPKGRRSKFEAIYPEGAKLKVLVKDNPKRQGSEAAKRFDGYFGAKKVQDALQAGVTYADIAHDVARGYIEVAA